MDMVVIAVCEFFPDCMKEPEFVLEDNDRGIKYRCTGVKSAGDRFLVCVDVR